MAANDSPFDDNPYAAPVAEIGRAAPFSGDARIAEAEAIRRKYLGHEASIKSLGSLYYLGAFFGVIGVIASALLLATGRIREEAQGAAVLNLVTNVASTFLNVLLGRGLSQFRPWARWIVGVLSILGTVVLLGLTAFAAFTAGPAALFVAIVAAIPAYIGWMMLGAKGGVVFSPGYKEVIALTPHIKYKTSIIVKIFLGLLLLIILLAIVGAFLSNVTR